MSEPRASGGVGGMRVGVAGASGYAGGELLRLISGHPHLDLSVVTADGSAGKAVGEVHKNLAGHPWLASLVFAGHDAASRAGCDLIFLALPAGQSGAVAESIPDRVKVVDLGPDFRLSDSVAWTRHYGGAHRGRWVTGLPELPGARSCIAAASRVAVPGCYATAVILALGPLIAAGLVNPADVVVVAASGTSGAGRALRADLLGSEVMGSVSAYQAGGTHRHIPEIEQALAEVQARRDSQGADGRRAEHAVAGPGSEVVRVSFTPLLVPMPRGILATCTARLAAADTDTAALRAALATAYRDEPFMQLLPDGRWPGTAAVAGSNGAVLQAAADL